MQIKEEKLHECFRLARAAEPEIWLADSDSLPLTLGDFLPDLDPTMILDWSRTETMGLPRLRNNILTTSGAPELTIDNVLVTTGSSEAIFLTFTRLIKQGDEIIMDWPSWPQPAVLAGRMGATVKRVMRREENEWRIDFAELAAQLSPKTKLIYLNNPNNPTGQVMGVDDLQAVCELARRVGAYVLCDEVYAGLEWATPRVPTIASIYARGIAVGSVSKTLGLQGLRIGWMVSPDLAHIDDCLQLRLDSTELLNIMGETIADLVLQEERYRYTLDAARAEGYAKLQIVDDFVSERPELEWHFPSAGFLGMCRLNLPISSDDFAARMLEVPYRTSIIAGSAFDCPQHIRIGVGGVDAATVTEGMHRLGQFLETTARGR